MFHPARPRLRWSSEANWRARLYGSVKPVETVPISPIRSVPTASADSSVNGSKWLTQAFAPGVGPSTPSARNTESNAAASAVGQPLEVRQRMSDRFATGRCGDGATPPRGGRRPSGRG